MSKTPLMIGGVMLVAAAVAAGAPPAAAAEVNVYSARKENLIKPLLERFTQESGIAVNLVTGSADALLKRLEMEGANSPADVFITVDAGRLHRAEVAGVLQPVASKALEKAVPASYRDPQGHWFGLSLRARPIMYARERVDPSELSSYLALADDKWRGRVCMRSSNNIYNQSLVASLIAAHGEERTEQWARGLVANFARSPTGGDTDQLEAVAAGLCDVTAANTYYLGRMLNSDDPDTRALGAKVAVFWPNQDGRGAHVNVSGAGVTSAAPHREAAVRLVEFLVTDAAQQWYAEVNNEYPVKPGVKWSATVRAWGRFKADDLNLDRLGELNAAAVRLMDRAGWQ